MRTALVSSRVPSLIGTSATICPIAPAPVDRLVLRNLRNDWQGKPKKSGPVPIYSPQIPPDLSWARTRATAMENW
jgi:hypothetical protein